MRYNDHKHTLAHVPDNGVGWIGVIPVGIDVGAGERWAQHKFDRCQSQIRAYCVYIYSLILCISMLRWNWYLYTILFGCLRRQLLANCSDCNPLFATYKQRVIQYEARARSGNTVRLNRRLLLFALQRRAYAYQRIGDDEQDSLNSWKLRWASKIAGNKKTKIIPKWLRVSACGWQ